MMSPSAELWISIMRLALAGLGLIGERHASVMVAEERCDLVAIIEPNITYTPPKGVPVFSDMSSVDLALDAIVLATPTQLHHEQTITALKRGWHVLVEKPITSTLKEAEEVVQLSAYTGKQVLVGHHRRHHPKVRKIKQLLDSGVVGDVVTASMIWALKKPDDYFEGNWRSGEDGSPVLINGVHDVDLLRYLLGEIETVEGFGHRGRRGQHRTESAAFVMQMASGALVTTTITDTAPSPWGFEIGTDENPNIGATHQDMLFISGNQGAISFPSLTIWSGSNDWSQPPKSQLVEVDESEPLVNQLNHFIDVLEGKQPPIIDAKDGMKTLAATLRMQELSLTNI